MEGVLYKWTNYLAGWQPRWFVLDNGILSYYDSQDDVCKGSKGSIKMAVCEIKVHATDSTRMELIIPGEQHFYMKAVNAAERQRWLVALGSAKACLADTRTKKEKEISEANESLKTKMSELRLYCDLLMQQVHTIQEFVHHDETRSPPSIENMNEASSLLSATCNTFITTLEECVKIANAKFKPEMFQLPHPDPLVSPVSPSPVQMMKRSISQPGPCYSERNSLSVKEPVSSVHRFSQQRRRTYSDTESYSDAPFEDSQIPCYFRSWFTRKGTRYCENFSFINADIRWKSFDFGWYSFTKQEKKYKVSLSTTPCSRSILRTTSGYLKH